MDSAHVIESLGFELEYASEERMFERQERLAGFARGRGQQVIAEVFDEMSPPGGEVLRLDRLELDLGPVDEEDLEHDLARRLRDALRLALSDGLFRAREEVALLSAAADGQTGPHPGQVPHRQPLMREREFVPPASPSASFSLAPFSPPPFGLSLSKPPGHLPPQASVHPRTHAWRAALLHFLQHGHLPWHADRHLAASPGAALQAVLHEDGPAFAAALRALPPTSPAWRRLAGLVPEPLRLHLARLLAPTAGDWLQDLANALGSPAPAAGVGTQGWRDQAWAALLPALMSPGSAATLPARLRDLLRPMMATVADPAQAPALAAVRAALREPVSTHPDAQPQAVAPEDDNPPSQRSFWRARLEAALQAGSLAGTADTWRDLLRHDRAWLRTRVAALGRSARTRRILAQGLDPALLQALLGVWVDAALQDLVAAVIHRLQQLAVEAAARGHAAMTRITAPVLWEHTLGHLWMEGHVQGETQTGESRPPAPASARAATSHTPSPASAGEQLCAGPPQAQLLPPRGAGAVCGDRGPTYKGRGEGKDHDPQPTRPPDASAYVESLLRRLNHAEGIPPGAWASPSGPARPPEDFPAATKQVLRLMRTAAPEPQAAHGGAASPAPPQAPGEPPASAAADPVPPLPARLHHPPNEDTDPTDPRVRPWRHLLLAALTAPEGAAHALDPRSLDGLLHLDAAWLRATLQRLGQAAHVRRRVAQDLGPALLRDLLGLWVPPARQDAIAAFVHGLASLARRQPALARLSADGLWAHVLGHLWLEQDPARPETVAHEQALARSVLRQLAEHGEIAPSGWPALLGPGGDLDAAVPWVLGQIGRLPRGAGEAPAGDRVATMREAAPPPTRSPASAGARVRAGAGARSPLQAEAANGKGPAPQPSPAEAGEGVRGANAPAGARGNASPVDTEDDAKPPASQHRLHAWRRLLLAALAPTTAATQPPDLDPRGWAGLLRHDAAWLRATLQRLGRSAAVRRRIAHGLDAGLLRDLTGLWVPPALQHVMAATVHGLDGLARRQPPLSGLAAAGLWEHALAWLWLERRATPEEAAPDERAFVQSVLRHLERRGDVAPSAWQALLGPAADQEAAATWVLAQAGTWAQDGPSSQPGITVAHAEDAPREGAAAPSTSSPSAGPPGHARAQADALRPPGDHLPAATPPKATTPAQAPATARTLRTWRRRLRTMLAPQRQGAAQAPWEAACWEGLLRHDAAWLRAKVQRLGRFATVRRAVAHGLSPALLHDLTGLWVAPDRQDFIAAFVQGLGRVAASNPGVPRVAEADLWAQALGLLWVDLEGTQAGAGGERAFVLGMVRHLERHEGVEPAARAGQASTADEEAAAAWVRRQILEAQAHERTGPVVGKVDEHAPQPRRLQLAAAVSTGRFEADFETLWLEVSRDDALWLRAWLCREDLGTVEQGEALALRQAQPERGSGGEQAQGEQGARGECERGAASVSAQGAEVASEPGMKAEDHPLAVRHPTQPPPRLSPLAALRRALAQRLAQPRWQPSLAPWLTPSECIEVVATVRRLAQSPAPHGPQTGDLEAWLWDRTLARLWRLPPQRVDLHALAQQLAQDLAQRSTPSPASAGEQLCAGPPQAQLLPPRGAGAVCGDRGPTYKGRGEGSGLGGAAGGSTANGNAPHPNPLPLMRERESAGSPLPLMQQSESVAPPLVPTEASPPVNPPPPAAPATATSESPEQALLHALQSRTPLPPADAALWRAQWAAANAHPSPHWRHHLRLALETPPAAARLVELLPRAGLVAALRLLRPTDHADWQATATLITQASRATGTPGAPGQLESLAWQAIFREAIEEGRPLHTPAHVAGFARRLVAELARQLMPPDPPQWQRSLVQALARGSDTLAAALRADLQAPTPPASIDAAPWDRPVLDWDDLADGDALHVANAGLVLAGPYLPRLLRMLGLAGDVAFNPPEAAAERGVHLLQAVVDGRGDTAEPLLVLNKLLCGLPLAAPVPPAIELTDQELAAIDGMLKAMIQHWRTLGHTSVAGLRETFLQREGRLMRKGRNNDAWHLVVQRRPLDVLLDRLPWGFATIKYPWMEQVLHVQWS